MACHYFVHTEDAKGRILRQFTTMFQSAADARDALHDIKTLSRGGRAVVYRICGTGTKNRKATLTHCRLVRKKWKCKVASSRKLSGLKKR